MFAVMVILEIVGLTGVILGIGQSACGLGGRHAYSRRGVSFQLEDRMA